MSDRDSNAAVAMEFDAELDGLTLEKENRELATKQVRQINDTLRKVRRISRESQQMQRVSSSDEKLAAVLPSKPVVEEVVLSHRTVDSRRERDDSTDKFFIPEPALDSPVTEVFRKAFEMFERECVQFRFAKVENSPVVRKWKLV